MAAVSRKASNKRVLAGILTYCSVNYAALRLADLPSRAREAYYVLTAIVKLRGDLAPLAVSKVYRAAKDDGIAQGARSSERPEFYNTLKILEKAEYLIIHRGHPDKIAFTDKLEPTPKLIARLIEHAKLWCARSERGSLPRRYAKIEKVRDKNIFNDSIFKLNYEVFKFFGVTYWPTWHEMLKALDVNGVKRTEIQRNPVLWVVIHALLFLGKPSDYISVGQVLRDFGFAIQPQDLADAFAGLNAIKVPDNIAVYDIQRVLKAIWAHRGPGLAAEFEVFLDTCEKLLLLSPSA